MNLPIICELDFRPLLEEDILFGLDRVMSFYSGVVLRVAIESNSWLIAQDEDARLSSAGLESIILVLLSDMVLPSVYPTSPFIPVFELVPSMFAG
jgi:hypothetical protein